MYARIVVLAAYAIATVSAQVSSCNSGSLQCCNQVQNSQSFDFSTVLTGDQYTALADLLKNSNAPVGVSCSPIASVTGAAQCNQQTVCCDDSHYSGLVATNCNAYNGGDGGVVNGIPI